MADAVAKVLPSARTSDVESFTDNEVGGANAYAITSRGGVQHTLLNYTSGLSHELDLEIKPVKASPWRYPSDTFVDENGVPQQFTPGELAASVFEYFPIYASTSSTSIGTAQVYNFSAAPLQAFNIGDPIAPVQETVSDGSGKTRRADIPGGSVPLPTSSTSGGGYYTIRPEFGGAPGNQAINNVFYPPVSLQGGLKTGASATITATDRRGYRMPPDTAPKLAEVVSTVQATQSPTPGSRFAAAAKKALSQSRAEAPLSGRSEQLKRPYVLRELDVLFEVTGQTPRALSELTDTLTRFGDSLADQVSDGTVAKRLLSEPRRDNAGEAIAKASRT